MLSGMNLHGIARLRFFILSSRQERDIRLADRGMIVSLMMINLLTTTCNLYFSGSNNNIQNSKTTTSISAVNPTPAYMSLTSLKESTTITPNLQTTIPFSNLT